MRPAAVTKVARSTKAMQWRGTFSSTHYVYLWGMVTAVHGDIRVTLPADFAEAMAATHMYTRAVQSTAAFVYRGMYRHGDETAMQFTYSHNTGVGTQEGRAVFHCHSVVGEVATQQRITFTATAITADGITGTYESANPLDRGTFALYPAVKAG
jgi:hypothetical protein